MGTSNSFLGMTSQAASGSGSSPQPEQHTHSSPSIPRKQPTPQHAPANPSGLREAHTLSTSPAAAAPVQAGSGAFESAFVDDERTELLIETSMSYIARTNVQGFLNNEQEREIRVPLLRNFGATGKPIEYDSEQVHPGPCHHGTFSPASHSRSGSVIGGLDGGIYGTSGNGIGSGGRWKLRGGFTGGIMPFLRMSTAARITEEHGIKASSIMYFTYYIPFFAWIKQYKWSFFHGDLVAAITMASLYIPMALSYASNLGHVPPINGLYSFVFNPIIYALLGSCPQLIVGPEAAGSLLLGSVVRDVTKEKTGEEDSEQSAKVAGLVTGIAGAVILIAGLARLGFLDNVLSRPFMRGFISSVGFIIIIDQLIEEMGLSGIAAHVGGVAHGSSIDKIGFLFSYFRDSHALTCIVAGVSFLTIMVCRELKRHLQPRYPGVAFVPDRFLVVVLSAVFTWYFRWDQKGLHILGEVRPASSRYLFPFNWPFQFKHMPHIREAMGTSFLIALLGFFESSVAAKALGGGEGKRGDGIKGIQLSPNRELVALGVANLVGGCFSSLPAFGGYGRSILNSSTGGKTPMSNILLSIITIVCIVFLLPYFYFLPKAVLSSMITVVALSLIEEAPHDISFFIRIRGYTELGLMLVIFSATIFYSLSFGIAIGVGLSLLSVIRHSTRPRIQILGRIPGTNRFENAEDNPEKLEFIEGCLIVKIPEPLTFANTGDLKSRLLRLELYGSTVAHPALPRVREPEHNRNVIFDIHGVTSLDGSGAQVLEEIVQNYRERGVRVFFSRGPLPGTPLWELFRRSGILEKCGGAGHFVSGVQDALLLTEVEALHGE